MKRETHLAFLMILALTGLAHGSILSKEQKHALELARPYLSDPNGNLLLKRNNQKQIQRELHERQPRHLELMMDPTSVIAAADSADVEETLKVINFLDSGGIQLCFFEFLSKLR